MFIAQPLCSQYGNIGHRTSSQYVSDQPKISKDLILQLLINQFFGAPDQLGVLLRPPQFPPHACFESEAKKIRKQNDEFYHQLKDIVAVSKKMVHELSFRKPSNLAVSTTEGVHCL